MARIILRKAVSAIAYTCGGKAADPAPCGVKMCSAASTYLRCTNSPYKPGMTQNGLMASSTGPVLV